MTKAHKSFTSINGLNTITTARALAANVEVVCGYLEVGAYSGYVEVEGKLYSAYIQTIVKNKVVRTRVFKSRKEQCEYLRDLQ